MLESILTSDTLSVFELFICSITSLLLGFFVSFVYKKTGDYSKNFLISLIIIPLLVQAVILMVNGNLGTSIAIASAFSLIRFRSIPGNSREILALFISLTIGLATGMGEILFAVIITVLCCLTIVICSKKMVIDKKILKIVVPEDFDYSCMFNDIFNKYNLNEELINSKTINLGSLFELTYKVEIDLLNEKKLIDDIRCINGNLKISLSHNMEEGL